MLERFRSAKDQSKRIERRAEQAAFCRASGRALIDAPIKPERRADRRLLTLALSLGVLAGAPDAEAKPTAAKQRVEQPAATPETAATEAAFERLQNALTISRRDLANNEFIRQQVSPERLELALTVIENIPIKDFVSDLALITDIPVSELVQDTELKAVGIYTPNYLQSRYEPILKELEASGDPEKIHQAQRLREQWEEQNNLGGYAADDELVMVNIKTASDGAGTDDADFARRIYRAATHEIIHSFVSEETLLNVPGATVNYGWIEEGLVDYTAERLVERHPLYGQEIRNSGYIVGPLPAARVLADTLGEHVMIRHLIQENWQGIGQAFDAEFGSGSWDKVQATTFPLDWNDDANMLTPVYGMLRVMGTERDSVIAMSNQQHPDIRLVPVVDKAGEFHGVLIREAEVDWKVTNGLVVEPVVVDGQANQLVVSVNGREIGTPRTETKSNNVHYALLAPEYSGNPADSADAYVADRVLKRSQSAAGYIGK